MELVRLLGLNVRRVRRERRLSQEELSFRAEMKRAYLSDLERGTRNPSVRALGRIAMALNVPPATLLEGKGYIEMHEDDAE